VRHVSTLVLVFKDAKCEVSCVNVNICQTTRAFAKVPTPHGKFAHRGLSASLSHSGTCLSSAASSSLTSPFIASACLGEFSFSAAQPRTCSSTAVRRSRKCV